MPPTVLIVEDEPDIAELIRLHLEEAGFACRVAGSLAATREALQAGDIGLVLLDVMLPDGDGFALCEDLRRQGDLPVVMVTARSEDLDRIRGLEIGADDYITKPFHPRELVARVKAVWRRLDPAARRGSPSPGEDPDVTVDDASRSVTVRGKPVYLTPKEFELLRLLVRHPGRVFSRDELLSRIWGETQYVDPKTVDVHIRRLREKIEEDAGAPSLILTVWGVGYKFRVPLPKP